LKKATQTIHTARIWGTFCCSVMWWIWTAMSIWCSRTDGHSVSLLITSEIPCKATRYIFYRLLINSYNAEVCFYISFTHEFRVPLFKSTIFHKKNEYTFFFPHRLALHPHLLST